MRIIAVRLIFDEMLRNTARWARIAGVDSLVFEGGGDDALMLLAVQSRRAIVTRDKELAARCKKIGVPCILITTTKIPLQLKQLATHATNKMRCPLCNTPLRKAGRKKISGLAPASILARHREFWVCTKCSKAYWKGSHWKHIYRVLHTLARDGKG
ncbi:MAG: Mut7-C RNAse domain-containing protein [Candidatus Micrarchaeota archaeon]|nr:Mut7-C RNAse domain-containing protein [Candidatus Micrarchaeota archaeon]